MYVARIGPPSQAVSIELVISVLDWSAYSGRGHQISVYSYWSTLRLVSVLVIVNMSTTNLNAFESIPEEHVADTLRVSETMVASGNPAGNADSEPDKYENTTDPTVLRKARAVAKANHTRSIRAINETNLNNCPTETVKGYVRSFPELSTS